MTRDRYREPALKPRHRGEERQYTLWSLKAIRAKRAALRRYVMERIRDQEGVTE